MALCNRNGEKKRSVYELRREDEDVIRSLCRMGNRPVSPRSAQEQEKRIRREIANSNERRRMQSINAGFQYLRQLLPQGDEKLSKASILQQTADYIYRLEHEKTALLEQNSQLKRAVMNSPNRHDSDGNSPDSPFAKRKKLDTGDLSEESVGIQSPASCDNSIEEMRREIKELIFALECEKTMRINLEAKIKQFESHRKALDNVFDVALQDHLSYHATEGSRKIKNNVDRIPKPHTHNNEVDNFHQVPDSNEHEVPEDLSGRHSSPFYSSVEASSTSVQQPLHTSPPAYTIELEVSAPPKETYVHSTSRQNLETIVEAIRHLEGDHMFRDDPVPPKSPVSPLNIKQESETLAANVQEDNKTLVGQRYQPQSSDVCHTLTLQHQIIRNAPVSQSRPGVIVSKMS